MRYMINKEPPYYATLSEARKAAMQIKEPIDTMSDGDKVLGFVGTEDRLIGVVTILNDREGFYWVDIKKEVTMEINEDGTIPNLKEGIRTNIVGEWSLENGHGDRTQFRDMNDVIAAFIHHTKIYKPKPWTYQIVFKNDEEVGKLFLTEKGHLRFLRPDGTVLKISKNGKIGEVDGTIHFKNNQLLVEISRGTA